MKQSISLIIMLFLVVQLYSQEKVFQLPSLAPAPVQQIVQNGHSGSISTIRIRCRTTAGSNNAPLYVVDGVLYEPSDISQINPADILEIHVLKTPVAETIYGCRALHGVIIITTKKIHHREFIIKDAKSMLAVSNATLEAKSVITGKVSYFVADTFGRFETDSLKTNDYEITISSAGYKTSKQSLKSILQNKGEIKLEPAFIEMEEVIVVGRVISCRRMNSTCYHQGTYTCSFVCGVGGMMIQKQTPEIVPHTTVAFHVYPNPIAISGTLNISFSNIKPGLYQLRLLNATGQLFCSFQKQISGKGETEQIHLNGKMLPGMYIIQILDEQKKLLQSGKIVVQ